MSQQIQVVEDEFERPNSNHSWNVSPNLFCHANETTQTNFLMHVDNQESGQNIEIAGKSNGQEIFIGGKLMRQHTW